LNLELKRFKNNPLLNQDRNQFSEMTDLRESQTVRKSLINDILSSKIEDNENTMENVHDPAIDLILDLDIEQEDLVTSHSPSFGGNKIKEGS